MTDRDKLKAFATSRRNKDVLLLAMQGLTDRQIASNLQIERGTILSIVSQPNDLLGNDEGISTYALGESLRGMKKPTP
jgi:DNA-binding NarL/FixJ family response regulator